MAVNKNQDYLTKCKPISRTPHGTVKGAFRHVFTQIRQPPGQPQDNHNDDYYALYIRFHYPHWCSYSPIKAILQQFSLKYPRLPKLFQQNREPIRPWSFFTRKSFQFPKPGRHVLAWTKRQEKVSLLKNARERSYV